jgi:hypothetical protein
MLGAIAMFRFLTPLFFMLIAPLAHSVELSVVTTKGYVAFTVPDDWRVLSAQTKPPVSALSFQVANAADEGTPHSTNVLIALFHIDFERGKQAADAPVRAYGSKEPVVATRDGWTVYAQEATQGGAEYVIVDAKRPIADVVAAVRVAWPRLAANAPDYDSRMRQAFDELLKSVSGGMGLPPQREGQVIRRPAQ